MRRRSAAWIDFKHLIAARFHPKRTIGKILALLGFSHKGLNTHSDAPLRVASRVVLRT
jgi:hypothetical protein